jgi:hypothetical protein
MSTPQLKIYKNLDVDLLMMYQEVLPGFIPHKPSKKELYTFDISEMSGVWTYRNEEELYMNKNSNFLPQDEDALKKAAADFFRTFNSNFSAYAAAKPEFKLPVLLPSDVDLVEIQMVSSEDGMFVDHLICRFQPFLRGSSEFGASRLPVVDAMIDLRIGNHGKVIGARVDWRPLIDMSGDDIVPFADYPDWLKGHHHEEDGEDQEHQEHEESGGEQEHEHEQEHEEEEQEHHEEENDHESPEHVHENVLPENAYIGYLHFDESTSQTYYMPFYVMPDGHHKTFLPATKNGMIVQILQLRLDNSVKLGALVIGGSSYYDYEWACYQVHELESGITELGTEQECEIPFGHYTVMLTVVDKRTRNIFQQEINVFSHDEPPTEEPQQFA